MSNFKCGIISVNLNTPYTKILSSITLSNCDMIGVFYTNDKSSTSMRMYDIYTGVIIKDILSYDHLYNCPLVKSVTSSTLRISNGEEIIRDILNTSSSPEDDVCCSLVDLMIESITSRSILKGNVIIGQLSERSTVISTSSVIVRCTSNDISSIANQYTILNKLLFNSISVAIDKDSRVFSLIFDKRAHSIDNQLDSNYELFNAESEFFNSFPDPLLMKNTADILNAKRTDIGVGQFNFNKIVKKMIRITDAVTSISRQLNKVVTKIDSTPILNIMSLIIDTNICCEVLELNKIHISDLTGSYSSVLSTNADEILKIGFNGSQINLPLWNADLTMISTAHLKDIFMYLNNSKLGCEGNLQEMIIRELGKR